MSEIAHSGQLGTAMTQHARAVEHVNYLDENQGLRGSPSDHAPTGMLRSLATVSRTAR